MKLSNSILLYISISLCCIFVACDDSEDLSTEQTAKAVKITSCNIDCAVISDDSSRAGENYAWQEGDALFIQLGPIIKRDDTASYEFSWTGVASFSNNKWKINAIYGSPTSIEPTTDELCNIIFAQGGKVSNIDIADSTFTIGVKFDECCPMYSSTKYTAEFGDFSAKLVQDPSTTNARFTLTKDGTLSIKATLNPILTRFRIKGPKNEIIRFHGVGFLNSTSTDGNLHIDYITKELTCSVEENGQYYTPYFYGAPFNGPISILLNDAAVFGRQNLFALGKSYELILPSVEKPGKWIVEPYEVVQFYLNPSIIEADYSEPVELLSGFSTRLGIHYDFHINFKSDTSLLLSFEWITRTTHGVSTGQEGGGDISPSIIPDTPITWKVYASGKNAIIEEGSYITVSNF